MGYSVETYNTKRLLNTRFGFDFPGGKAVITKNPIGVLLADL